ncbi:unnamed protein product [Spirodela intermedia]|uniref:Disease resistance protein winged helix domain-containing protein n=1 Tax=Spirodela intermedia TaxID=51605 RepID=A0A7I8J3Q9_SPIIN|nr:unnamed protein product [Spirodela intermedia]CAA6664021.1 unnamed protein product [Spirodela intermedia]
MTCGTPRSGRSSVGISQTPRTEAGAGETLEETAEGYLGELVQRCMVILVRDDFWAKCRIHDLLHDFTCTEAKEVGFLVSHGIRDDGGASQLDSSVRRLSLQGLKGRTGTRSPPQDCAPCCPSEPVTNLVQIEPSHFYV